MATTKITSNVMALSAAQNNINSGSSFIANVPTTINNTLTVTSNLTGSKILAGNGTLASPAYSFTSDPSTGLYRFSSGRVVLVSLGTSIADFSGSGLVLLNGVYKAIGGGVTLNSYCKAGDENTGINFPAADNLGLASGGVNRITITNTTVTISNDLSVSGSTTIPIINGNTTFTNNIIGNGTDNSLPNQTIVNNSSIMTRGLAVRNQMLSLGVFRDLFTTAANINTSGAGSAGVNDNLGASILGSLVANAWQRVGISRVITNNPAGSGGGHNCSIPITVAVNCFPFIEAVAGTAEIRLIIGDAGSGAPPAIGANALTGRGWGLRIFYDGAQHVVKLCAHNGTTYSESSSSIPFSADSLIAAALQNIVLSSDGLGNIRLYYTAQTSINSGGVITSPVAALSMTGGPTSGNTSGHWISLLTLNGPTPPTSQSQLRFLNAKLLTGEIF